MEPLITHAGAPSSRRAFFKRAGLGAGVVASATALQACDSEKPEDDAVVLDFSTDFGVLNYAYALEQLEAAFYAMVVANIGTFSNTAGPNGAQSEQAVMRDLAAHEAIHAAFLKSAISGAGGTPIPNLTVDFSSITFTNKMSVLGAALAFEDLGVSAYNGAGKYIRDAGYLTAAGKIVSVEARHASAIRALILNNVSSGSTIGEAGPSGIMETVIDNSLDRAREPNEVLGMADTYIVDTISYVPQGASGS